MDQIPCLSLPHSCSPSLISPPHFSSPSLTSPTPFLVSLSLLSFSIPTLPLSPLPHSKSSSLTSPSPFLPLSLPPFQPHTPRTPLPKTLALPTIDSGDDNISYVDPDAPGRPPPRPARAIVVLPHQRDPSQFVMNVEIDSRPSGAIIILHDIFRPPGGRLTSPFP